MCSGKHCWLIGTLLLTILLSSGDPLAAQEGTCESAPVSRLTIGGWASVTPIVSETAAGGLKMRANPFTTAEQITLLPAGSVLRVVDGPACNDGFKWWYLHDTQTDLEGWSAEGLLEVYYLMPVTAPVATPAPAAASPMVTTVAPGMAISSDCPEDPAPAYVRVGSAARVANQARPIRLRVEPDADSYFLQLAYQDAVLNIVDGPACADGYRWWKVDVGGRVGWTIEAANGRYLLIDPANPPPDIEFAVAMSAIPPQPPDLPPDVTVMPTARPVQPPAVVKRVAYTADGLRLVVGSGDGIRLYDAAGYALQGALPAGPVLDLVMIGGAVHAVTWAPEGIRVMDALTGNIRTILTSAPHDPEWAAAASNGEWLILGPTSDGATATLWDLNAAGPPSVVPYWWPGWGVVSANFSPDNNTVLINDTVYVRSCIVDGTGCLFDLIRNDFVTAGVFGHVNWSGDGERMIGFSDRFWLWDGNVLGVGFTLRSTLNLQNPRRVALNTDGTRGAVVARSLMELWDLREGSYVANRVVELPGLIYGLAFKPDGTQLAAAVGNSILIYDPVGGGVLYQVE